MDLVTTIQHAYLAKLPWYNNLNWQIRIGFRSGKIGILSEPLNILNTIITFPGVCEGVSPMLMIGLSDFCLGRSLIDDTPKQVF